mgnify:CR=1 FL=1
MTGGPVNALQMKPILDQVPKPQGEPIFVEEGSHRFLIAFARGKGRSLASLSVVQTLFQIANQAKNLTLGGIDAFQTA